MIKIGLTGSIGSGKSTIGRMAMAELGIPVFDADHKVHELYATDKKLQNFLINKCGSSVVKDGVVDRGYLKRYMTDPVLKNIWMDIQSEVGRRVWQAFDTFIAENEALGKDTIIADIPFLFEYNSDTRFDYTMNVYLPYEAQKKRALARQTPKITEDDFNKRYASFMPIEERNKRADFTIDNSGSVAASFLQFRAHLAAMTHDRITTSNSNSNNFNKAAVYVGSFDPMTLGHIDVVKSAAKMPYDTLYIGIGINPAKNPLFTAQERVDMIEREMDRDVRPHLAAGQRIIVTTYEGLTVDFMKHVGSSFCIRGLRGVKDLEEESSLASINQDLYDHSTGQVFSQAFFATSDPALRHVSSSTARALCLAKQDLPLLKYVSADVAAKMIEKRESNKSHAPK